MGIGVYEGIIWDTSLWWGFGTRPGQSLGIHEFAPHMTNSTTQSSHCHWPGIQDPGAPWCLAAIQLPTAGMVFASVLPRLPTHLDRLCLPADSITAGPFRRARIETDPLATNSDWQFYLQASNHSNETTRVHAISYRNIHKHVRFCSFSTLPYFVLAQMTLEMPPVTQSTLLNPPPAIPIQRLGASRSSLDLSTTKLLPRCL